MRHELSNSKCPNCIDGYRHLSNGNQLVEAEVAFEKALRIDVQCFQAMAGLGIVFRGKGEVVLSKKYLDAAIKLEPDNLILFYERSVTHHRLGLFNDFLKDFDKLVFNDSYPLSNQRYVYLFDLMIKLPNVTIIDYLNKKLLTENKSELQLSNALKKLYQKLSKSSDDIASIAVVSMVVYLMLGRAIESTSYIYSVITTANHERYHSALSIIEGVLSQDRIGNCKVDGLRIFIDKLSSCFTNLLEGDLDDSFLKVTFRLCAMLRLESIEKMLEIKRWTFIDVDDATLCNLFLFRASAIHVFFKKIDDDSAISLSLYKQLCLCCLGRQVEAGSLLPLDVSEQIKYLQIEEFNHLVSQVHQTHYNIYISGNLKLSHSFSTLIAYLYKAYSGSFQSMAISDHEYLTRDWVSAFGHILYLDLMLNAESEGIGPKIPRRINCKRTDLANDALVELLESNGFSFIDKGDSLNSIKLYQMDYVVNNEGKIVHFLDFCNHVQAYLIKNNISSYIHSPSSWKKSGDLWSLKNGIPLDKPIAVMHLRESTYWTNLHNVFMCSRNVNPQDYSSSIRYLLNEGYSVIRIGDQHMSPIHDVQHPYYFDLTSLKRKPHYLDFYLLQRATLFLGTTSGPSAVANLFQTESLLTNWAPLNVHIPNMTGNTLIMPKMVKRKTKILSLSELMEDPFSCSEYILRDKEGVKVDVIDNSPEEILLSVKEMHARLNGDFKKMQRTETQEKNLQNIWKRHIPWDLIMPHCFLSKYYSVMIQDESKEF